MVPFITRFWLSALIFAMGCATPSPTPGVRDAFKETRIRSVVVAPVYALDPMGLGEFEHEALARAVARAASTWLVEHKLAVTDQGGFEATLRAQGRWEDFRDAWYRGVPLSAAFESAPAQFRGVEVETTRRLSESLDADALLLIQILYQGDVICAPEQVRQETPYAVVSNAEGQCVVTHLEGKLIDSKTGLTVWHNVAFVEADGTWDAATRQEAIHAATRWLLGSSFGITTLLASLERQPTDAAHP